MTWTGWHYKHIFLRIRPIYNKIILFRKRMPTSFNSRYINSLLPIMILHLLSHVRYNFFFKILLILIILIPITKIINKHNIFNISICTIRHNIVIIIDILNVYKNGKFSDFVLWRILHFPVCNYLFNMF